MALKKAHFIGIAGMGLSAAAILLKEQGWEVSGSDEDAYPPATTQLERHGIRFSPSYKAANIPENADIIVIGKNTRLAREENEEVRAAYDSGTRIVSFPELLGELLKERERVVVAGSYGKSTTTALVAWILSHAGVDAGWFVGAATHEMEPSHLGTHPVFVLEGDEYPTSHEDPHPKFAHYAPHDALITAATHDHVNIYRTPEDFLKVFEVLAAAVPSDGVLVLCADEPNAASLAKHARARVVSYGVSVPALWHVSDLLHEETTTFTLMKDKEPVVTLSTRLIGDHNIQNIVGASALLLEKKLITPAQLADAVASFKGLTRRLDKKTKVSRVPAYEGFGSSREKLRAAISAIKTSHPNKRLVVVFEPHTFSWRNKQMLHWFDTGFKNADVVLLYKPAEQGASTHEQATQEEMLARLMRADIATITADDPNTALEVLEKELREGDVVLLSSSGPMDGLIEKIPEWLDTAFA